VGARTFVVFYILLPPHFYSFLLHTASDRTIQGGGTFTRGTGHLALFLWLVSSPFCFLHRVVRSLKEYAFSRHFHRRSFQRICLGVSFFFFFDSVPRIALVLCRLLRFLPSPTSLEVSSQDLIALFFFGQSHQTGTCAADALIERPDGFGGDFSFPLYGDHVSGLAGLFPFLQYLHGVRSSWGGTALYFSPTRPHFAFSCRKTPFL